MAVMVERVSYVKRFKMEMDLSELPSLAPLSPGHGWIPWDAGQLDAHADVLYHSFRQEIDASVFVSFGDRIGCICLMTEMSRKPGFLPSATWLLQGPNGYLGSVQGLRDRAGIGAIQNLGVLPGYRGQGFGTALLLRALLGFREAGLRHGMLEVTARNESAIRLYRRLGFRCRKTVYKAISVATTLDDAEICL